VVIKGRDSVSTLFSFDELYANLQVSSLFKKGLILREIRLEKPYINLIRTDDGSYNISDLAGDENKKEQEKTSHDPLRFSLNNIQILNGSVDFRDGPKHTRHEARDITLNIPVISNFSHFVDIFVHPLFQATINGTAYSLKGKTKPFHDSRETVIDLKINNFDIPHYLEYVPLPVNFRIISGTLHGEGNMLFRQYRDRPSSLIIAGDIILQDLKVADQENRPLIDLPLYSLKKAELNVTQKEVTINEASSKDGTIFVTRSEDGTLNVQPQLPKLAEKIEEAAEEKKGKPWIVLIKNVAYDGFTITFEDRVPAEPVHLVAEEIHLIAENISTEENSNGVLSISLKLNKKGTVSAESALSINPVSGNGTFSLKDIDILPLKPYITDRVNLLITDGVLSAEGNLSYESAGKVTYAGEALFSRFSSVDKRNTDDFLTWNSLYFDGVDIGTSPFHMHIKEIALTDFYSRLIVNPDGTLNVQEVFRGEEEHKGKEAENGEAGSNRTGGSSSKKQIKIDTITLQGGHINLSDYYIQPNYSANLLQIGGRISGLSSEETALSDVVLRGNLESHAPIEITGTINPLKEDLSIDLKVRTEDIDMSQFTPYSGKHIGYTIQKGKLHLNLKYKIDESALQAENTIFLDQFTLGKKVESPEATKLPLELAIALLKDKKGEIHLDLPVSGQLDDTEFSLGKVIFKMFVNLIIKAATSPFALLGAVFGGGENLDYLEFDHGSSGITDESAKKLDILIKALSERPALKLDISGFADIEKDREALIRSRFDKKVASQKLQDMVKKGTPSVPLDEITVDPTEYEEFLWKAYKAEDFPKPRNVLGMTKKLPVPEMEKLILTHIVITEDDLRLLASGRELAVKDYIIGSQQVEADRLFTVRPESISPEKKEGLKDSRVVFAIK
jgi:hypothetical protein